MIHHPNLGNDFRDQPSTTEKSHYRAFGNYNTERLGNGTHVGGGNVTAAKFQRHVHFCGHRVEVAARRKDSSFAAHDEATIQLRQFLDGSPQIEIGDVE